MDDIRAEAGKCRQSLRWKLTIGVHGNDGHPLLMRCMAALAHPRARGISASLHVIACVEVRQLIATTLGHIQQPEAQNDPLGRAPLGHREQTFNRI